MGLKDELAVLNDPDDEVEEPEEEEEDEEEPEADDPQETLKESCQNKASCVAMKEVLDRCTERVEGKENTSETCEQELYDFIHCVDHCVEHSGLWSKLK